MSQNTNKKFHGKSMRMKRKLEHLTIGNNYNYFVKKDSLCVAVLILTDLRSLILEIFTNSGIKSANSE